MTHRGRTAEERRVSMALNLKCVRKEISEGRRILRFRGVKCVAWPLKYDSNMCVGFLCSGCITRSGPVRTSGTDFTFYSSEQLSCVHS